MKKHDLYELIATLSSNEKKLFKEKYAGKEDGNFIRLFDVIANGKAANDDEVKKIFAGEKFVGHLHKTKAYLYEALLSLLYQQLQPHFVRLQLLQKIEFIEVLLSRKLIQQAEDIIHTAIKEAQQFDELELEQVLRLQLSMINNYLHRDVSPINHDAEFRAKMEEHLSRSKLFHETIQVYHTRGKKESKSLNEYSQHSLLKSGQIFLTERSKSSYEMTLSLLHSVARNYSAALKNNIYILRFKRKTANISVTSEIGYINTLFNTILVHQDLKKNDNELLKELEQFQPVSILSKSQKFVCLLRVKLNSYVTKPRSAEGKKLMNWIERELPNYKNDLGELERVKVYISIAALYMKEQEFSKALDYLPAINHSKTAHESRPIIERVGILYLFICHYELGNYELLGNTLRNYKYFQQTAGSFYLIEKYTLDFLNKAIRLPDDKTRKAAKADFVNELKQAATKEHKSGMAYLENVGWV